MSEWHHTTSTATYHDWTLRLTRRTDDSPLPVLDLTVSGDSLGDLLGEVLQAAVNSEAEDGEGPLKHLLNLLFSLNNVYVRYQSTELGLIEQGIAKVQADDTGRYDDKAGFCRAIIEQAEHTLRNIEDKEAETRRVMKEMFSTEARTDPNHG